jgi:hypothetical protein
MKNALMVPVVCFAHILIWSAGIAFFSVLSSGIALRAISSGNYMPLIIESLWCMLRYAPFIVSVAFLGVFFFLMRHSSLPLISIPLTVLLAVVSVSFLIPASYAGLERMADAHKDVERLERLSKGRLFAPWLIRPDTAVSRMIWFSQSVSGDAVSPLVTVSYGTVSDKPVMDVYPRAYFFRDAESLVTNGRTVVARACGDDPLSGRVEAPRYFGVLPSHIATVMDSFLYAYRQDRFYYGILVGSFFLAILALWFVCHAAGWRLLNVFFALAFFLGLYIGYPLTISGAAFDTIRRFLPKGLSPDMTPPLVYLSFSILLLFAGTGVWVRRTLRRHSRSGASYD